MLIGAVPSAAQRHAVPVRHVRQRLPAQRQLVLPLPRRAVKSKRDYLRKGSHFSWLYLSRLAALKEYAFMKALGDHGLPVPKAIDHNRHAVLMTLLDAYPLVQVRQLSNPRRLYVQLMEMLARLAGLGLVHCDYNEFNLLVNEEEEITLIDFPQMVSVSHPNAQELFERDVECIIRFFSKKLGYVPEQDEELELIRPSFQEAVAAIQGSIDTELRASGFKREHQDALDRWVAVSGGWWLSCMCCRARAWPVPCTLLAYVHHCSEQPPFRFLSQVHHQQARGQ
jgi:RIO kinase 2